MRTLTPSQATFAFLLNGLFRFSLWTCIKINSQSKYILEMAVYQDKHRLILFEDNEMGWVFSPSLLRSWFWFLLSNIPDIMSINEFRNLECRALGTSSTYRSMLPPSCVLSGAFCVHGSWVWDVFFWKASTHRTAMVNIVVQSLSLCNPMDCSTPRSSALLCLPEFAQIHVHWVGDAIWPSHPLPPPSPFASSLSQRQGLFHRVNSLYSWPKYWSFNFSISPSNEYSGLISFRIDWFGLCAAQGTLKSLPQHHNGD